MLNFQEFKEEAHVWIRSYLNPRYGDVNLFENTVMKNNCSLTGITVEMNDALDNVRPTFYLEPLYERYLDVGEFDEVMGEMGRQLVSAMGNREEVGMLMKTLRESKDQIFFHLIHTEQNHDLLQDLPHRDFLNLSIVYRVMINLDQKGMASVQITNSLAKELGFDEQELYDLAYENTKSMMAPVVKPMGEMVLELLVKNGAEGMEEIYDAEKEANFPFYIVTNQHLEKGAINVVYPEVIKPLAEKFDSDLYLLPMSVHEMLVIPKGQMEVEELAEMLHKNNPIVDIEDRLSNDIYMYDKDAQSIFQVTNHGDMSLVDESELVGIEEDSDMGMGMC